MEQINTKYGTLKELNYVKYYEDGAMKECTLDSLNKLKTPCGLLTPKYEYGEERSKHIPSVAFYNNGNLKKIYLEEQTGINTSIGILPAEFITFYESGNIKRVFPLNGKITGYWSEKDEYNLAKEIKFDVSIGKLEEKVISVYFYESGSIKSITFWSKDDIKISSPIGNVYVRIGVSFYEDGKLKSFEPLKPTAVPTEIGTIMAYNTQAIGIHGDSNSVKFFNNGGVESLITSTDSIEVISKKGEKSLYEPLLRPSVIDENFMEVVPLNIEFCGQKVKFTRGSKFLSEYAIDDYNFYIKSSPLRENSPCSSCEGY
ncbi:hypothetical protein [Clostridium kluyveri]|uniref:MORN repeat variant n=1 Tax=Clostridium kluyveri TaxID=1534 RepID=A0A1L5FBD3_CLOKL|nr:hypothetical protein [Clostridium kluyveri]APM40328.1 hypothetical protein BS101_17090 [Clostridium kluyveri]